MNFFRGSDMKAKRIFEGIIGRITNETRTKTHHRQ